METKPRIVAIDDESDFVETLKDYFELRNYEIDVASKAVDGIELISAKDPDVVILDLKMPGLSGLEVLEKIKDHIVFQYVDETGEPAGYPHDPNGSVLHIAGITDTTGRILGMMPHPERHINGHQHPLHTRKIVNEIGDGLQIFKNAVEYFDI